MKLALIAYCINWLTLLKSYIKKSNNIFFIKASWGRLWEDKRWINSYLRETYRRKIKNEWKLIKNEK